MKDPTEVAKRAMELAGGARRLSDLLDAEIKDFYDAWDRDIVQVARLLRAHLTIEHFMTRYLTRANPRLGSLKNARLSFSQKLEMLDEKDKFLTSLRPGIRKINQLRNELVHHNARQLTSTDIEPLMAHSQFKGLRDAKAAPATPSNEPVVVLEDYARFVCQILQNEVSEFGSIMRKAMQESESATEKSE